MYLKLTHLIFSVDGTHENSDKVVW
jgi:hypothetical protein